MTKWKRIKRLARELRKNPTDAERKLWELLRKKQIAGRKFLRQHPIIYKQKQNQRYFFIADFYCAKEDLVVELDGKIHDYQQRYDHNRDLVLNNKGLDVLRIKNKELRDIAEVRQKILNQFN